MTPASAQPQPPARARRSGIGGPLSRAKIIVVSAAVAAIALALILGFGLGGGSSVAPAEAQAQGILTSAAGLQPGPGEVAHYVYRMSISGGSIEQAVSGTTSVWFGRSGGTSVSAQDITLAKGPKGSVPLLLSRYVQIGDQLYGYDGTHNAILLPFQTETASLVVPSAAFDTAAAARSLQAALAQNGSRLVNVTQETLDGHAVDAVTVDGAFGRPAMQATFYFDAQTHVLRGFDAHTIDPSYPAPAWTVRLVRSEILPAAQAPADTFKLAAPADARVQPPTPDKQALLGLLPDGLKAQRSGMSVREAVQAAHPGMSEDAIIRALFGSATAQADAAVAAGQITPTQAATLAQLERFEITVPVGPAGGPSASPQPAVSPSKS